MGKSELLDRMQSLVGAELFFLKRIENGAVSCDIFHCHNTPEFGVVTFVTIGLSDVAGREIVVSCRDSEFERGSDSISLLAFFVLIDRLHIDTGVVVSESDDLPGVVGKVGFYMADPIYFGGDASYACWALFIAREEAEFIAEKGAAAFEDVLDSNESSDLLSIDRASVV